MTQSSVSKNVFANFIGQIWVGLIGIAFIPFYVHYMGVESYGIIGFFVTLQALFSFLDMGLSATLTRELARVTVQTSYRSRTILRTIEVIYLPFAIVIVAFVWGMSNWFSENWLETVSLTPAIVAYSLSLLGLSAALQWPSSLYIAGLTGLQRQVLVNAIRIIISTVSAIGCLLVLMRWPDITTYLYWQIATSTVTSFAFCIALYLVLPKTKKTARFSFREWRHFRGFAGGVFGITLLSLVLTQADRLILSSLLNLKEFGYYALAASLAAVVYRVAMPLFLAYGPRFAQMFALGDNAALSSQYHLACQWMAVMIGPVAAVSIFFGHDIVLLWSRDLELTLNVAPIFSILVAAWSLHALMNLPYALQLAAGWTSLSLWINFIAIIVVLPLFFIFGYYGEGVGTALAWLCLTILYVFLGLPLMHKKLLKGEFHLWVFSDVGPVIISNMVAAFICKFIFGPLSSGVVGWIEIIIICIAVSLVGISCASTARMMTYKWIKLNILKNR